MTERYDLGGTDGVRGPFVAEGHIGEMTPQTVGLLSHALTNVLQESGVKNPEIIIAGDTRWFNHDYLLPAAELGVRMAGGVAKVIGVAPTPTAQKRAQHREADGTIVLSASHNPGTDAGWKGMIGSNKPYGDEVKRIDTVFWDLADKGVAESFDMRNARTFGTDHDEIDRYIAMVGEDIQQSFGERPLEGKLVAVDAARGAAGAVTPRVLELLGATVEQFACDTEGDINDGCGATHLEGLQNFLRERPGLIRDPRFLGAVANDGDADRVMGVGVDFHNGNPTFHTLDGNTALELMAEGQEGVVGTVYTNDATVRRIKETDTDFEFCPNGDVHVTRALQKNGWQRGAEFSGHLVDRSWLASGDGVRMAALLLSLTAQKGTNFAELRRSKPLYPELMQSIRLPRGTEFKIAWIEEVLQSGAADKAHDFRHVTRASGTEPLVRVWGVGSDQYYVDWRVNGIVRAVRQTVSHA